MLIGLLTAPHSLAAPKPGDYRQQMRTFVRQISAYAKQIRPDFIVIAQNAVNLISLSDSSYVPAADYIEAIDGIGQERLFYGYNADDQATTLADRQRLSTFLDRAKDTGNIAILVTDYCATREKIDDSYAKNQAQGYIAFAATHRELDNIPAYPSPIRRENARNIQELADVKNFLYLLSPDSEYSSKKAWLAALKKTNYDLIIIDLFLRPSSADKNGDTSPKTKSQRQKTPRQLNYRGVLQSMSGQCLPAGFTQTGYVAFHCLFTQFITAQAEFAVNRVRTTGHTTTALHTYRRSITW